ncbi:MAG: hypothetical protein J6K84_04900 [Oscillospiraceae bacterium]|nr:hypothetical protein [Oscillospiraceae bacterium]
MSIMQQTFKEQTKLFYGEMNTLAENGGVVFFGTDLFAKLPFGELAQSFHLEERIYNRSMENMRIGDAAELLNSCVLDLNPSKVFFHLGDTDVCAAEFDVDAFIAQYEWILYTLHTKTKATAYVVSLLTDSPKATMVNQRLKALAQETGTRFVDITGIRYMEKRELHLFDIMKHDIRSHPLRFEDAVNMVAL